MAKVTASPPDLMFVDIAFGGRDGRLLAHWLRQHEAKVIALQDELGEPEAAARTIPIVAISSFAPGADVDPLRSCSFGLTRKEGLSESELLELIVASARQVRPRYAPWSSEAGLAVEMGEA